MIAVPVSRLQRAHQVEDLRLDGDVERRGRLVGDQQPRLAGQRHRDHRALAHAARQLVRILVEALLGRRDAHLRAASSMRALAAPRRARCARWRSSPSTIWSPMVKAGFSDVIGSWKIIAMPLPRRSCSSRAGRPTQLAAFEADRAAGDAPRRLRHQAHDRQRRDALAAARFADDGQRACRPPRVKLTPSTAAKLAVVGGEVACAGRAPRAAPSCGAPSRGARVEGARCAPRSRARSVMPTGSCAAGQAGDEGLEALQALVVQAPQLARAARRGRRRGCRAAGSPRRRGCAAPPPACRACRRRRPRRPPARRAAARPGAGRRVAAIGIGGGVEHLRAGEHVAGDAEVVADTVAAPVDAGGAGLGGAVRRAAGSTCSWRWSRPASAAVSAATTSLGRVRLRASSAMPCRAVQRIHQRLRRTARRRRGGCARTARPTAKKRLAMATPKRPAASRARIDQVIPASPLSSAAGQPSRRIFGRAGPAGQ